MLTYTVCVWHVLITGKTSALDIWSDLLSAIPSQATIVPNSMSLTLMGPPAS